MLRLRVLDQRRSCKVDDDGSRTQSFLGSDERSESRHGSSGRNLVTPVQSLMGETIAQIAHTFWS